MHANTVSTSQSTQNSSFQRQHSSQPAAVLGIFIWVGQSKAKQILGRPTGVLYVGIMGMTRAVWVGQTRVWVGRGLPRLIARTASVPNQSLAWYRRN